MKKDKTLLSFINNVVFIISIFGFMGLIFLSFNQCVGKNNCSNYELSTNYSQIGLAISGILISSLIWAFLDLVNLYLSQKIDSKTIDNQSYNVQIIKYIFSGVLVIMIVVVTGNYVVDYLSNRSLTNMVKNFEKEKSEEIKNNIEKAQQDTLQNDEVLALQKNLLICLRGYSPNEQTTIQPVIYKWINLDNDFSKLDSEEVRILNELKTDCGL